MTYISRQQHDPAELLYSSLIAQENDPSLPFSQGDDSSLPSLYGSRITQQNDPRRNEWFTVLMKTFSVSHSYIYNLTCLSRETICHIGGTCCSSTCGSLRGAEGLRGGWGRWYLCLYAVQRVYTQDERSRLPYFDDARDIMQFVVSTANLSCHV